MNAAFTTSLIVAGMLAGAREDVPDRPAPWDVDVLWPGGPVPGERPPHLKVETAAGRVCFQCGMT